MSVFNFHSFIKHNILACEMLCEAYRSLCFLQVDVVHTWCGYKITGLNFCLFPCKVGNSELCVVLAYLLPSIHG